MHLRPAEPEIDDFYVQMASAHDAAPAAVYEDPFDDVFGSDSEAGAAPLPPHGSGTQTHGQENMTPDIRRLQVTHSTTGYREGITEGKAQSIQAGFDEGYGLGANVGLKAGQILGLLEGIAAALAQQQQKQQAPATDAGADGSGEHAHAHSTSLLAEARAELKTESIFDQAYWSPDGSWKYDVTSSRTDGEILFEDVADAHPLIVKWKRITDEEMRRWDLHLDLASLRGEEQPPPHEDEAAAAKTVKLDQQPRQALEW